MFDEKIYLRELAQQYLEIANLPVMQERSQLWYQHNQLQGPRPMVVMEMLSFEDDLIPPLKCTSVYGKQMELELLRHIVNHEKIDDDKVVPAYFTVTQDIQIRPFNLEDKRIFAIDSTGKPLGWKDQHFIEDLEEDLAKLTHSTLHVNESATQEYAAFAQDVLKGCMPIQIKNKSLEWALCISLRAVELMGMEPLLLALYDSPDKVKELYTFICDDVIQLLRKSEELELLTPNNGNDYAGAGSYGFSNELHPTSPVRSNMLWGNMNSQETVTISEAMYREFVFPHYQRLSREFGLVYYGCCEPVHTIWESCVSKLHNLRKVSVSAWCDEAFMGQALARSQVIYSRKPSPNLLGVHKEFDREAYKKHIAETLTHAKDCCLEIIHRDVYTLSGNEGKPKEAVAITRQLIEDLW